MSQKIQKPAKYRLAGQPCKGLLIRLEQRCHSGHTGDARPNGAFLLKPISTLKKASS
jgi:hypothetical protein